MPSAIGIAFGIVCSGSRTSSPSVAIRAYPAKAKKSRAADCSTPYTPPLHRDAAPPRFAVSASPLAAIVTTTISSASTDAATSTRASPAVRVIPW